LAEISATGLDLDCVSGVAPGGGTHYNFFISLFNQKINHLEKINYIKN